MDYDPATIPLAPPPPGVTPNFVDPPNRAWWIYVTTALCLFVTTLVVALRFYSKIFVVKQMAKDDCIVLQDICVQREYC